MRKEGINEKLCRFTIWEHMRRLLADRYRAFYQLVSMWILGELGRPQGILN
jgi:hypothetical protein